MLNKKFRSSQKTLDRELAHFCSAATELETSLHRTSVTVDDVTRLLGSVTDRLRALKRKVGERGGWALSPTGCGPSNERWERGGWALSPTGCGPSNERWERGGWALSPTGCGPSNERWGAAGGGGLWELGRVVEAGKGGRICCRVRLW